MKRVNTTEVEMSVWTKKELPIRESPVNFAAFAGDGTITSNAWGVRVKKTGDAYIYCRDNLQGQAISLHRSGKQHIRIQGSTPGIDEKTFLNQWREPEHINRDAVATFRLVFPAWGIWLDGERRGRARADTWPKNDVLIEVRSGFLTVVSFVILDATMSMTKAKDSHPSAPIAVLRLRPGKTLYVIAGREPEPERYQDGIRQSILKGLESNTLRIREHMGEVLHMTVTGWQAKNSAFMVNFPIVFQQKDCGSSNRSN